MPQDPMKPQRNHLAWQVDGRFAARVIFTFGIGMLFLLIVVLFVYAANVLILMFSGILLAILLDDATGALEHRLPLSRSWGLGITLLLTVLVFGAGGWMLVPRIVDQANQLASELPGALQRVHDYLATYPEFRQIESHLPSPAEMLSDVSSLAARAGMVFSGVLGVLGNILIVLFVAIYLAASPSTYVNGALKLLPPACRPRGRAVADEIGRTLTSWLRGKLLSMFIIGCAIGIGLALLGVPLALTLGILAGLLDFIPYIGPIIAALPAVLIAFAQRPDLALMVGGLFIVLQSLEGYLLVPLVERKTVAIPPALTIMMQVLMGFAFGLTGVAIATPLAAVLIVLVAMLYVQDVLGDSVTLPAQHGRDAS